MYKNCTTEHTALRQQELEEYLLKNMLIKPYCDISIIELCQQASISRKSFYRYFGSKDGCLCALLDRVLIESSQYLLPDETVPEGIQKDFVRMLSFWKTQSDLLNALITNNLVGFLLDRMIRYVASEEQPLLQHMGLVNQDNISEHLLFCTTGFLSVLVNWVQSGFQKSEDQMAASLTALFTQPLIPNLI